MSLANEDVTVTDADRDKAARALWPLTRYRWPRDDEMTDEQRQQWERVAAALADARAEADQLRDAMRALADAVEGGAFGVPPARSVVAARVRDLADGGRR